MGGIDPSGNAQTDALYLAASVMSPIYKLLTALNEPTGSRLGAFGNQGFTPQVVQRYALFVHHSQTHVRAADIYSQDKRFH